MNRRSFLSALMGVFAAQAAQAAQALPAKAKTLYVHFNDGAVLPVFGCSVNDFGRMYQHAAFGELPIQDDTREMLRADHAAGHIRNWFEVWGVPDVKIDAAFSGRIEAGSTVIFYEERA